VTTRAGTHRRENALGRPAKGDTVQPPEGGGRKQLRRRTMRGLALMGMSTAGQALLQLIFLSILARLVAPGQFGLVSGALIAVYLTTVLAESGIGVAIVQRANLTAEHMRVGYTLSVSLGVICWALLAGFAPQVEDLLRLPGLTPILRVIAFVFVINSLTLSDYLLSRRLQFGRLALAEVTSYAVGYGAVAITLAQLGYGAWAIVWGQLGQSAMRTILVTCMAPHTIRFSLARAPLRDLLNFGGAYSIGRIALWAATQIDNVVVGRYLGAAALGFYGRAYQLVQMPANLFGQVANEVLFPAMASVQGEQATLRRVFRMGVSFLAMLALPCSILAAVTSKSLVLVLLGRDWLPLRAAFDVIIFGLLFRTSSKLTDSLMKARGAVYRRGWRSIVFAAMVFAGAFVGQRWGLHGVAVGVLIALGINYLLTNQLCLTLVGMRWRDFLAAHVPALILSAAAGATGFAVDRLLDLWHPGAAVRLLIVWAIGIGAILIVVRTAWRTPVLRSISALVAALHSMLFGRAAAIAARLLGPGYAPLLRRQEPNLEPERRAVPTARHRRPPKAPRRATPQAG
jgi:O-antigen/teichoic acid export membrane protein